MIGMLARVLLIGALVASLALREGLLDPTLSRIHPTATGWDLLVHTTSNAFHSWRWDPLLVAFFGDASSNFYALASLTLLAFGLFLLLPLVDRNYSPLERALDSILIALTLPFLFGFDPVVLGSVCWVPWCIVFLRPTLFETARPLPTLLLGLFFVLRLARASHQFSLLLIPFTLYSAAKLGASGRDRSSNAPLYYGVVVTALVIGVIHTLQVPPPPLPDYPQVAQVVPDDGVPGRVAPLVTSYSPTPIIDRLLVKDLWFSLTVLLLVMTFTLGVLTGEKARSKHLMLLLALFLGADILLPESFAIISPVQTLRRVLPGGFYVSYVSVFTAILILMLLWSLYQRRKLFLPGASLLFGFVLIDAMGSSGWLLVSHDLLPNEEVSKEAVLDHSVSPSYRLYRTLPPEQIVALHQQSAPRFRPLRKYKAALTTSAHQELQGKMIDGKVRTRWSEQTGRQLGKEWIQIAFPKPIPLTALYLGVGPFTSDFPRGLRVENAAGPCTENPRQDVVFEQQHWQGPLTVSEDGYPFFGAQHRVVARFPTPVLAQCLTVRQTGKARFDWSVTDIRVATAAHSIG